MFSTLGDIMSTLRDVQHIREISWCIWGSSLIDKSFQFLLKTPVYSWYPPMYSWYPLMYWTSLNVLMVSPTCIMISPNVLNIPQCIHDIPLPYALMVPSDVFNTPNILMIFPLYTEDLPMYWTTHYTGWFYVCNKSTNENTLVFFLFNCEFMHFWCHTIYCSPVGGKPKKTYLVFLSFFLGKCDYMEWPSKHSCNYKVHVTVIIYFLALYS